MAGFAAPGAVAQAPRLSPAGTAAAVVTIAPRNRLFIGDRAIAPDRLVAELRRLVGSEGRILLRADRRVRYADVMVTLGRLHAGGFRRVALLASPPD
ncbi:biopolymer transporter ExbD [Methylopila sp. M107]|uniref:ExbD/TolR family protein n=1 Tax=Methylopila sp. M107 TaxID=1101190 RepID=UPI00036F1BA7|nr:biopolymer transporter ExbD [Methylopila sp. M107]